MDADSKIQAAARANAVRVRAATVPSAQERAFWIGLACAAVLHAALIVGITRSLPRQVGEKGGRPDGISVMLVDAADLASKNTFAEDGAPGGAAPPRPPVVPVTKATREPAPPREQQKAAAPPVAEAAPEPAPPPEQQKAAPPVAKAAPVLAPPPDEAAKPGKASKEQKQQAATQPIDTQVLETVPPPEPAAKPSEATPKEVPKPQPKPTPPQQPAQRQPQPAPPPQLQLSMPDTSVAPGGRSANFARPAGITRSGENDEFGRGVIRALRQTFHSAGVARGRVTVRFLLSDKGNLVEVQLVSSAGNPTLDQSVVFAVKQSNFPLPPLGATIADRTFLVTYIYN